MKSLKEYIVESCDNGECQDKAVFTFNLKGMDDIDDIKKQLEEIENCEIDDDKITLNACKECENTKKVFDILKKYSDEQRSSQHRSSDEQYAQKTVALKKNVDALDEFINAEPEKIEEPKEKEDDKKEDDKKEDDKKDEK